MLSQYISTRDEGCSPHVFAMSENVVSRKRGRDVQPDQDGVSNPKRLASSTARAWCFTLNNYTEDDVLLLEQPSDLVRYLVCGREVGESGTPHLQGYIVFHKPQRMAALKKMLPRAHIERARGDHEANYTYCSKDGDYFEVGDRPSYKNAGDAEKARWEEAKQAAIEGRLEDIPADIFVRHYRTLKEIKKDHMKKPDDADDVTGLWIWGPPGSGKSRSARARFPNSYFKMQNKWWDGYQGEETVILDDFDCKELGHHLKIWADRYSYLGETKGGALHIRPKLVIFTSNYHPSDPKFGWDPVMAEAIERRMTIEYLGHPPTREMQELELSDAESV